MQVSAARQAAFDILLRLEAGHKFAVDLLHSSRLNRFDARDRNLTHEMVMGVGRLRIQLDFLIEKLSGKPAPSLDREVLTALRMGIYQIRFLEKIPKSAAVNASVELTKRARKRSAAGLVNAVLRKCSRGPIDSFLAGLPEPDARSIRLAHPAWLLERWTRTFGADATRRLAECNNTRPPLTLRVVGGKPSVAEAIDSLGKEGIEVRACRFAPGGLRVDQGNVTTTKAFRRGLVAIQDEASQLVSLLLGVQEGDSVLDLCAAPAMKTSHFAESMKKGRLVASDLSLTRLRTARRLAKNMRGAAGTGVPPLWLCCDGMQPLPFVTRFDRILVDVPCSGTGTIQRNPEIKWRLNQEDLSRHAEVQRRLLENALPQLKPGGRLIYSTCSLEPEENEQVVEPVLAAQPDFSLLRKDELGKEFPALESLFDSPGWFRTHPAHDDMDGFFAAVISRE